MGGALKGKQAVDCLVQRLIMLYMLSACCGEEHLMGAGALPKIKTFAASRPQALLTSISSN